MNWYNEIDPYAAQWLRNLIQKQLIPPGVVDERPVQQVKPLSNYVQCHFFAGIAGWSHALALSGWPADRPVWTGSCPCQPFSNAGKRGGVADDRHLWPWWRYLIAICRPPMVFGEQVASKDGRAWLSLVRADLETLGYACGAADLCAAGAGAPHIRQRLFWVADANMQRTTGSGRGQAAVGQSADGTVGNREIHILARPGGQRPQDGRIRSEQLETKPPGIERHAFERSRRSPWADLDWLPCTDGKARPTQPGIFPLAHGIPGRVGRLRAYGNAIVPQVAAEFIKSVDIGSKKCQYPNRQQK